MISLILRNDFKKLVFIILFVITIIVIYILSFTESKSLDVAYSTYNTKDNGTKALYYLSKRLGYDVIRYKRPAMFLPDKGLMVMIKPYVEFYSDREQKYLKTWVEKGNKLLIIEDNEALFESFLFEEATSKKNNEYFEFTLEEGKIIVFIEPKTFINRNIFANEENGILFMDILNDINSNNILFNEYYHGFGKKSVNLFDILTLNQIFIVIQIILIVITLLYTKSKRFGTPEIEFDLEDRIENENIFALSNILYKSRANLVVLGVYRNLLKEDIKKYLDIDYDEIQLEKKKIMIDNFNLIDVIGKIEKFNKDSSRKNIRTKKSRTKVCKLIKDIELIRRCLNNGE
jgi:hypothetical protein